MQPKMKTSLHYK